MAHGPAEESPVTTEPTVLSTSDDAAKLVTITGWKSRRGIFFGEDERTARYDGCTHMPCDTCSKPTDKHSIYCDACRLKRDTERYWALPAERWDGQCMIFAEAEDEYYQSLESFLEHAEDEQFDPVDLRPLLCDPIIAREVDPDYWCDDMAEDGELPAELEEALKALNAVIKQHQFVLSWSPSKVRLDLSPEVKP